MPVTMPNAPPQPSGDPNAVAPQKADGLFGDIGGILGGILGGPLAGAGGNILGNLIDGSGGGGGAPAPSGGGAGGGSGMNPAMMLILGPLLKAMASGNFSNLFGAPSDNGMYKQAQDLSGAPTNDAIKGYAETGGVDPNGSTDPYALMPHQQEQLNQGIEQLNMQRKQATGAQLDALIKQGMDPQTAKILAQRLNQHYDDQIAQHTTQYMENVRQQRQNTYAGMMPMLGQQFGEKMNLGGAYSTGNALSQQNMMYILRTLMGPNGMGALKIPGLNLPGMPGQKAPGTPGATPNAPGQDGGGSHDPAGPGAHGDPNAQPYNPVTIGVPGQDYSPYDPSSYSPGPDYGNNGYGNSGIPNDPGSMPMSADSRRQQSYASMIPSLRY
jgi:hypothetical protein